MLGMSLWFLQMLISQSSGWDKAPPCGSPGEQSRPHCCGAQMLHLLPATPTW